MKAVLNSLQLLRFCGLGFCALSAGFSVIELLVSRRAGRVSGCLVEEVARRIGWSLPSVAIAEAAALAAFAFLFWSLTRPEKIGVYRPGGLLLIAVQTVIGLATAPEQLTLVSFAAPLALPGLSAIRYLAIMSSLHAGSYYLQFRLTGGHPMGDFLGLGNENAGVTLGLLAVTGTLWHGVTFSLGRFGAGERRRSVELAQANAELLATRRLEAETARVAERLGISRELHDAAGHRLTALNINLRLIRRLSDSERIAEKAEECLFLVDQLLTDVRNTVRDLRSLRRIDLREILETLVRGVEGVSVHLEIDPELVETEPFHAHTLFRCSQEILTNSLKHGRPRNIWISLQCTPNGILLRGRDDGAGVAEFQFGSGLSGMRERVGELGGEFAAQSRLGEGFEVSLSIPVRREAA